MASASESPSVSPSNSPSKSPSKSPSASPSVSPSVSPSHSPSASPSASPSPIPAGDVTYTIRDRIRLRRKYLVHAQIAFGGTDNDLYPTGGVALTTASLGFRRGIDSLVIIESNGDGLLYEWDRSANTIRIFYPTRETGSAASRSGAEFTANSTALGTTALEVKALGW